MMTARSHTEFVDAFYRIAQDRANKIVILTGAGGEFITDVEWSSFGDASDPGVWSQVQDEGVQVLENIANIRVPVIAAIFGSTKTEWITGLAHVAESPLAAEPLNRPADKHNAALSGPANTGVNKGMKLCFVWKRFGATVAGICSSPITATSTYPKTEMRTYST